MSISGLVFHGTRCTGMYVCMRVKAWRNTFCDYVMQQQNAFCNYVIHYAMPWCASRHCRVHYVVAECIPLLHYVVTECIPLLRYGVLESHLPRNGLYHMIVSETLTIMSTCHKLRNSMSHELRSVIIKEQTKKVILQAQSAEWNTHHHVNMSQTSHINESRTEKRRHKKTNKVCHHIGATGSVKHSLSYKCSTNCPYTWVTNREASSWE